MIGKILQALGIKESASVSDSISKLAVKNNIAALLKTTPEALAAFEAAYKKQALDTNELPKNLFEVSAQQAKGEKERPPLDAYLEEIISRIVDELLEQTAWFSYDGACISEGDSIPTGRTSPNITQKDLDRIPIELRPQLAGDLMKCDIAEPSYRILLEEYAEYLKAPHTERGRQMYKLFRQGLDILDLDPVTYEMIRMNGNSIGKWFPALASAVQKQSYFKVPATKFIEVPLSLLQLTRCDYMGLTPSTIAIVDRYCQKVFDLDTSKDYFVKTGVYSSKFDFRNAHVTGEKEVKELGEYLLFIHFLSSQMAAPKDKSIYGVATTTEWVVREYIPDKENNPTIYKGMPLHTEFRVFVDFDTQKIIGVTPYWEPEVMKRRFAHEEDADSPHQIHDYIIYAAHEETLMDRYHQHVDEVCAHLEEMIPDIALSGQWSVDIMLNGKDMWIIDMALAQNSALINCVPKNLLRPSREDWIPKLPCTNE